MPVRSKTLRLQTPHGTLRQITVLKTTARKHDVVLARMFGDSNNAFRQCVVEPGGNDTNGNTLFNIG